MPKTPITYYGGKQRLLSIILPLIPKNKIYTEAFFGGGAVFFAKEKSESEIINDVSSFIVNFYEVCISDFDLLKEKVEATLFSRATYSVAMTIYKMPHLFNTLQRAWAFYVGTNMGFGSAIGSWGFDKYGKRVKSFRNKKLVFDATIQKRLANVQVENSKAIKVLELYDTKDAFHYIDPPYVGTDLGHYGGYTEEDYKELLETLSCLKGKFLLSSFPSEILTTYIQKHGWHSKEFDKPRSASKATLGKPRTDRKIEVLTANYPLK